MNSRNHSRFAIGFAAILLLCLAPVAATGFSNRPETVIPGAAMQQQTITWATQADQWRLNIGAQLILVCPGGGNISSRLWGTDVYTNDSSICTAAVHAGIITREAGGVVTIEIRPGANSYVGTTRNGLTSLSYGRWNGSFVFIGGKVNGDRIYATWATQADGWRSLNGQRFTLVCPAGGQISGRLWGTNTYTDDSSICTAAVHSGLITAAEGGVVTIEVRPGASSYQASTRNGITSQSYGAWSGSFVFVGNVSPPPPTSTTISVGKFYSGEAYQDGTSKMWPFNLRLNYINQSTGEVVGEIHWTSLGSVHKIVGTLSGNRLRFTETEYIQRGGADLNCTYDLNLSSNKMEGRWWNEGNRPGGAVWFTIN